MSVGCSLPVRRLQLVSTGKDRSPLASLELFPACSQLDWRLGGCLG